MAQIMMHNNKIVTKLDENRLKAMLTTLPQDTVCSFVSAESQEEYSAYKDNGVVVKHGAAIVNQLQKGFYYLSHEYKGMRKQIAS